MIEYPKIETVYNRNKETFTVIPEEFRLPEFENIKRWLVTEKIDGTNIRVGCTPIVDWKIQFGGRTDNAQMPTFLMSHLQETFTADKMRLAFPEMDNSLASIVLFGEGYGEKIQKGGGNYRKGVSFRLFDVKVGEWWLNQSDILDVAIKLGVTTVPVLGEIAHIPTREDELALLISESICAKEDGGAGLQAEGVVARTNPLLLTRNGHRLMWKLKFSDFRAGKR